jgi:hypothetical protein
VIAAHRGSSRPGSVPTQPPRRWNPPGTNADLPARQNPRHPGAALLVPRQRGPAAPTSTSHPRGGEARDQEHFLRHEARRRGGPTPRGAARRLPRGSRDHRARRGDHQELVEGGGAQLAYCALFKNGRAVGQRRYGGGAAPLHFSRASTFVERSSPTAHGPLRQVPARHRLLRPRRLDWQDRATAVQAARRQRADQGPPHLGRDAGVDFAPALPGPARAQRPGQALGVAGSGSSPTSTTRCATCARRVETARLPYRQITPGGLLVRDPLPGLHEPRCSPSRPAGPDRLLPPERSSCSSRHLPSSTSSVPTPSGWRPPTCRRIGVLRSADRAATRRVLLWSRSGRALRCSSRAGRFRLDGF